jgi:ABC-type Fe3+-citrate transport system substrate-binding protein
MGAYAAIASAAVAVTGSVLQGIAADKQLAAEAGALGDEYKQLQEDKEFLASSREEEIELFQKETQELLGLQSVGFAKAGVEMSGSVLNVLNRTMLEAEEEESRILQEHAREASLHELRMRNTRREIGAVRDQRMMGPITTILGAGASGASSYYTAKKLGKK